MAAHDWIETDPAWMWLDHIQVGDVLLEQGDPARPRIVRHVSYSRKVRKIRGVKFTILHCSKTGRCTTTLSRADLKTRRFTHGGKRKTTVELIDKFIAHDLLYEHHTKQRLDCCDVKGIR